MQDMIASAAVFTSVIAVIIAVSQDIFSGEYLVSDSQSGRHSFSWRYATSFATKLRISLRRIPAMLFYIYFVFALLFLLNDFLGFKVLPYSVAAILFQVYEVFVVLYALKVASNCVIVRSRKHEGVRP